MTFYQRLSIPNFPAGISKEPICPARRWTGKKRKVSTFFDNRGSIDPHSEWEDMLPLTSGTKALRKRLHPAPPLDTIDPDFNVAFDNIRHGPKLEKELNIDHLTDPQQGRLRELIKEFWLLVPLLVVPYSNGSWTPQQDTTKLELLLNFKKN